MAEDVDAIVHHCLKGAFKSKNGVGRIHVFVKGETSPRMGLSLKKQRLIKPRESLSKN